MMKTGQVSNSRAIVERAGMPPKIRQLKAALSKAGFTKRPSKGSHTVWKHPAIPMVRVTIAGKDGDDAKEYLIEEVQNALDQLKGKQR